MEILIALIALLLVLSFLLKGSFLPRWARGTICLLLAAAVRLAIPWLARQPADTLNGWITAPDRMLDAAVCIVLEIVIMTAFCFTRPAALDSGEQGVRRPGGATGVPFFRVPAGKKGSGCAWGKASFTGIQPLLHWYPGLLAFPAVCWTWSQLLFSRPGIDFTRFAWLAAIATFIAAWGGSELLHRFVPEEEARMEGLFLVNLFLLLLTIAATGAITF